MKFDYENIEYYYRSDFKNVLRSFLNFLDNNRVASDEKKHGDVVDDFYESKRYLLTSFISKSMDYIEQSNEYDLKSQQLWREIVVSSAKVDPSTCDEHADRVLEVYRNNFKIELEKEKIELEKYFSRSSE